MAVPQRAGQCGRDRQGADRATRHAPVRCPRSPGVGPDGRRGHRRSALWARPEDAVGSLLPNYPLMWALFGVARPAGSCARRCGDSRTGGDGLGVRPGGDTREYVLSRGTPDRLQAEVRHARTRAWQGGDEVPRRAAVTRPAHRPAQSRATGPDVCRDTTAARFSAGYLASSSSLSVWRWRAACYGFAGGGLPPDIKTVAVMPFDNLTSEPTLTPADQRRPCGTPCRAASGLRQAGESQADAVVQGSITRYDPDVPAAYTGGPTGR